MTWRKKVLPFAVLLIAGLVLSGQTLNQTATIDPSLLQGQTGLKGDGVGTATGSGLTHTSLGVLGGSVFGVASFMASFTVDNNSFSGNGSNGSCARGSGQVVLTTPDGSTIAMQQAGLSCDTGVSPNNLTDNATYLIVGGTGRFSGVTGTGNLVTGILSGQVSLHLDGNIVLK